MNQQAKLSHVDKLWSREKIHAFGPLARDVKRHYLKLYTSESPRAGNLYLVKAHNLLTDAPTVVRKCRDLDDIEEQAKKLANQCEKYQTLSDLETACRFLGMPTPDGTTESGRLYRAANWHHWRRVLRKVVSRFRDHVMRQLDFVHKRKQIYCSDQAVEWQRQRNTANLAKLENLVAVSDYDDQVTLAEIQAASLANPALRRAEVLTRINGFEQFAEKHGHRAHFITITAPSKYHSHHALSGNRNKKYSGATPRDTQVYLCKVWARIRAELKRKGVGIYGFRIAEPHHDGCPHWHILVFVPGGLGNIKMLQAVVRRYALAEDGHEPGARKRRVKFEAIDRSKGTATGYIIKYVAKAIDGYGVEKDLYGNEAESAAARIVAWARTWGIRQFQQIGGPFVSVWREYRRIREAGEAAPPHYGPWLAADAGDWVRFMGYMGGATPGREQPSQLHRGTRVSEVTGECSRARNSYGEPLVGSMRPVVGILREGIVLNTRRKYWTIEEKKTTQSAIGAQSVVSVDEKPGNPWGCPPNAPPGVFPKAPGFGARTRVTNCTEGKKNDHATGPPG